MKSFPWIFFAMFTTLACSGNPLRGPNTKTDEAQTMGAGAKSGDFIIAYQSNILGEIEPCG